MQTIDTPVSVWQRKINQIRGQGEVHAVYSKAKHAALNVPKTNLNIVRSLQLRMLQLFLSAVHSQMGSSKLWNNKMRFR